MKNVMCPETKEIITIDETKEKDWQTKYLHRSGVAFYVPEVEEEEVVGGDTVLNDMTLEELHELYEATLDKKVSARYKNDKEWIISKLV